MQVFKDLNSLNKILIFVKNNIVSLDRNILLIIWNCIKQLYYKIKTSKMNKYFKIWLIYNPMISKIDTLVKWRIPIKG